ncbi:deformed epidermal autoregulatory factor 1 [Anaeramoeba flamelloides]|uniref:Deformed epidermal autoregulatory factor 1 n=1 Tax=Anaeramoeba flamelloides TaxID=1746091 RepID=A0ABQ8Y5W2_9EUKA|nr:deformed epidermal autoregulatory factor 1 [Anaeramoeba flamelloides]
MSNNPKQRGKRSKPAILTTWDSPFIVQKVKYTGTLADLLTLGDPHKVDPKKTRVYSKVKWSVHDIDKLSKFSRDYRLHFEVKKNNPEYYATLHALIILKLIVKRTVEQEYREVYSSHKKDQTNQNNKNHKKKRIKFERNSDGCIKFLEPLIPIIGIFDFENEDFVDEFIQICKYSGDSLLPYLVEYKKKGRGLSYAFQAIHNLGCYWAKIPEIRKKVILVLNELIENPKKETPQFNSYVIDSLLECNAVESYSLIKRCYDLKCVDESFVEWDRVKTTLGDDSNSTTQNKKKNEKNSSTYSSSYEENSENSENENENENENEEWYGDEKIDKEKEIQSKFLNNQNFKNNEKNLNNQVDKILKKENLEQIEKNDPNQKNGGSENENNIITEKHVSKNQKDHDLGKREINQRLTNEKYLKEKERDLKLKELKTKSLHREFENKIQLFHQQRKLQNENNMIKDSEEYKKMVDKWILQLQEEDGDFDLSVDAELKECSFCKKRENKSNEFLVCKRCMMAERIVPYCSKECQKKHWDHHKKTCGQEFIKYWVHPRKKFSATYFPLKD